jgi:hypothetical protein
MLGGFDFSGGLGPDIDGGNFLDFERRDSVRAHGMSGQR